MTGPGDEIAPAVGGYGYLRASHADREQVIGILKAAFAQGLMGKDEGRVRPAGGPGADAADLRRAGRSHR